MRAISDAEMAAIVKVPLQRQQMEKADELQTELQEAAALGKSIGGPEA
ncbi:MAG: hypothetical protein R3264_10500 [Anaerolineae bacterium]|nr:hypothetical protein [Anaerolineae bacterium]